MLVKLLCKIPAFKIDIHTLKKKCFLTNQITVVMTTEPRVAEMWLKALEVDLELLSI